MSKTAHFFFLLALLGTALAANAAHAAEGSEMILNLDAEGKTVFAPFTNAPASPREAGLTNANVNANANGGASESASGRVTLLRTAGLLLLASGAVLLLIWRNKRAHQPQKPVERKMQLLERLPLGARRELLLVRACDRLLVLNCQGQQLTLLSDMATECGEWAKEQAVCGASGAGTGGAWAGGLADERMVQAALAKKVVDHVALSGQARVKDWPSSNSNSNSISISNSISGAGAGSGSAIVEVAA